MEKDPMSVDKPESNPTNTQGPTPTGSSTGNNANLAQLRTQKKSIYGQTEQMQLLFKGLDIGATPGARCANRACVTRKLLELAIEQAQGL